MDGNGDSHPFLQLALDLVSVSLEESDNATRVKLNTADHQRAFAHVITLCRLGMLLSKITLQSRTNFTSTVGINCMNTQ